MPDTAVTKKMIVYSMLSDVRIADSKLRNQRWRFWICMPENGTAPKAAALAAGLKLLDLMHEVRGSFGSTYIHFVENIGNADPFYDEASASWILIQDYNLKMRTLQ